jgi:hypothetical protein
MSSLSKNLALLLSILFLTSLITLTNTFVKASNINYLNYKLNLVNPNNNTIYSNTLPLNFDVDWSASVVPWFGVQFSYSIDNGVKIHTNGGGNYNFKNTSSIITTTTNDSVDISDLTNGLHKLTIFADGSYDLDNLFVPNFNYTFSPVFFSVDILTTTPTSTPSPTPTPTPSVPEFSWLTILPILLTIPIVFVRLKRDCKEMFNT